MSQIFIYTAASCIRDGTILFVNKILNRCNPYYEAPSS